MIIRGPAPLFDISNNKLQVAKKWYLPGTMHPMVVLGTVGPGAKNTCGALVLVVNFYLF